MPTRVAVPFSDYATQSDACRDRRMRASCVAGGSLPARAVASGLFELACRFLAGPLHRIVPRAALLGSLTAIALALITFRPLP